MNVLDATMYLKVVKMIIFILCYISPQLNINTFNLKITFSVMMGLELVAAAAAAA